MSGKGEKSIIAAPATPAEGTAGTVPNDDVSHVFDENALLMRLGPQHFTAIRRALNGRYFAVTDAICAFTDCQPNSARMKWSRVAQQLGNNALLMKKVVSGGVQMPPGEIPVKYFVFPRDQEGTDESGPSLAKEVKEGARRGVPCTTFRGLLTVLSLFDHANCRRLRQEMASLATRASAGDEALEKALPVRRQELAPEMRDTMRAGLAGFGDSAIKDICITQLQQMIEIKDKLIKEQAARLSEQGARILEQSEGLVTARLALQQQLTITNLELEKASKRRKLLLNAVPEEGDNEQEEEPTQYPAGSTCKGDPHWSRFIEQQARVFCERLARALTSHAKQVHKSCLDDECSEEAVQYANEEALAALRNGVEQVMRPEPKVLERFTRVHGSTVYSELSRIVCKRLPRANVNSTNLPLAHLFLYLVAKNAWGHAKEIEADLELESTFGEEIVGPDLYLYTLDEPRGLVRPETSEFQLRSEQLEAVRDGHADAREFFESRGIPARYLGLAKLASSDISLP